MEHVRHTGVTARKRGWPCFMRSVSEAYNACAAARDVVLMIAYVHDRWVITQHTTLVFVDCPRAHLQMAGDFTSLACEKRVPLPSHHHHELIDVHASVHCYLSAKVIVELVLFVTSWRMVAQELGKAMNTHVSLSEK